MSTTDERIRELHAGGMSMKSIACSLGVSYQGVRKAVDPTEHQARLRSDNAKRRAAKRAWENANDRPNCERCGQPMCVGANRKGYTRCQDCRTDDELARMAEMVRLRNEEGLTGDAIAQRVGTTKKAVESLLSRVRRDGVHVARDPYMEHRRETVASRSTVA